MCAGGYLCDAINGGLTASLEDIEKIKPDIIRPLAFIFLHEKSRQLKMFPEALKATVQA